MDCKTGQLMFIIQLYYLLYRERTKRVQMFHDIVRLVIVHLAIAQ